MKVVLQSRELFRTNICYDVLDLSYLNECKGDEPFHDFRRQTNVGSRKQLLVNSRFLSKTFNKIK